MRHLVVLPILFSTLLMLSPNLSLASTDPVQATGKLKEGKRDGLWTFTYKSSQKRYAKGSYEYGKRHGEWVWYRPNGKPLVKGKYRYGKQEGLWTHWQPNGTTRQQFHVIRQLRTNVRPVFEPKVNPPQGIQHKEVIVTTYYANDQTSERYRLLHNKKHGPHRLWYNNGQLETQRFFKQGKRFGLEEAWDKKTGKQVYRAVYQDDVMVGPFKLWFPTGSKRVEGQYDELGKKHGNWRHFHANGKLALSADHKHGQRQGMWRWVHPNGQLAQQAKYSKGKAHGPVQSWYDNGKPKQLYTYQYGKTHGAYKKWHKNGQLAQQGLYQNNQRQGPWRWWHPNGTLAKQGQYLNHQQHGATTSWHPNGKKAKEGQFASGRMVGRWKFWNEEGKLIDEKRLTP